MIREERLLLPLLIRATLVRQDFRREGDRAGLEHVALFVGIFMMVKDGGTKRILYDIPIPLQEYCVYSQRINKRD